MLAEGEVDSIWPGESSCVWCNRCTSYSHGQFQAQREVLLLTINVSAPLEPAYEDGSKGEPVL